MPAFPLSADILSAWIKPTLILFLTVKKTTHSNVIYLNILKFVSVSYFALSKKKSILSVSEVSESIKFEQVVER